MSNLIFIAILSFLFFAHVRYLWFPDSPAMTPVKKKQRYTNIRKYQYAKCAD